jgi:UDPglucose 6-dehydrogenase
MNPVNGQCDTSIVESVVKKFKDRVDYFLIKSTVEIGTTDRLSKKYHVKIAQSPEYVGETLGHPLIEPRRDGFQIIGGTDEVTEKIASFWRTVLHANAPILVCTAREAEIIKYCENLWIAERVSYWQDIYDICETFGASFTRVREGLVLDPRFSRTHSNVYPNNRGWGGKCLSKDPMALVYTMREKKKPLYWVEGLIKENYKRRSQYKNKDRLLPDTPPWIEDSKEITLTKGYKTIVDTEDYEWLNKWSWYYAHGYAVRTIYDEKGKPYQLRMHRLLINTPDGMDTDHVNRNRLDNRKSNLRPATRSQNVANQFSKKQNNSGLKGVSWKAKNKKWVAQIRVDNVVKHIGLFESKEEAGRAYNREAVRYFGKFAYLNDV